MTTVTATDADTPDTPETAGLDLTVTFGVTWHQRALAVGGGMALVAAGIGVVVAWYLGALTPSFSVTDPLVLGLVAIPVGIVSAGRGRHLGLVLDERGITRHHLLWASTMRWSRLRRVWVVRDDRGPLEEGVTAVLIWAARRARRLDRGLGRRGANALALFVEDEGRARRVPTHLGPVPAARPPEWQLPHRAPVRRTSEGGVELRRPVALCLLLAGPPLLLAAALGALAVFTDRIAPPLAIGLVVVLVAAALELGRRALNARVLLGEEEVVLRGIMRRRVLEVDAIRWVGASRRRRISPGGVALLAFGLGKPEVGRIATNIVGVPGRRRTNARIWWALRDWAGARGIPTEPVVRPRWGRPRAKAARPGTNPWRLPLRRRLV